MSDAALASCVHELRQALEDDARAPRYIETLHRRGYRFIARSIAVSSPGALSRARHRPRRTGQPGPTNSQPSGEGDGGHDPPLVGHAGDGSARASPPRAKAPVGGDRRLDLPVPGTPLIGRNTELGRLGEFAAQAQGGRGSVVIVRGEAGIGKTRLLAEVAGKALERDFEVLVGRGFESEQLLAFSPWVAAVRGGDVLAQAGVLEALASP